MIQLRSGWSHEGGTWSCPGGALELGEEPLDGALREASEEVGLPETEAARLLGQYEFRPGDRLELHDGRRARRRGVRADDELRERGRRLGAGRRGRAAGPAPRVRRRVAARPPDRRDGRSLRRRDRRRRRADDRRAQRSHRCRRVGAALLRGRGADPLVAAPAAASAATPATRCAGCRSCASPSRSGSALDEIRTALASLPEQPHADAPRLGAAVDVVAAAARRPHRAARAAARRPLRLHRVRVPVAATCPLYNPGDVLAARGPGRGSCSTTADPSAAAGPCRAVEGWRHHADHAEEPPHADGSGHRGRQRAGLAGPGRQGDQRRRRQHRRRDVPRRGRAGRAAHPRAARRGGPALAGDLAAGRDPRAGGRGRRGRRPSRRARRPRRQGGRRRESTSTWCTWRRRTASCSAPPISTACAPCWSRSRPSLTRSLRGWIAWTAQALPSGSSK